MLASILALSTALPDYPFSQADIQEKMIAIFDLDEEKISKIKKLYQNSAIETRYSVIPDFAKEKDAWQFWGPDFPKTVPDMKERNDLYKIEAPKLALEAARLTLDEWGGDPKEITHIISVSCTGMMAPGIEFNLIEALQLDRRVERLGINFMGCFGAFKGLSIAQSLAKENPKNRILLICTELCSLHFQIDPTPDNLLANSLFSDGAAAVIVGAEPRLKETPLWTIHHKASLAMPNTKEKMTWDAGNHGFEMKLSHTVPVLLSRQILSFVETLAGTLPLTTCDFAIHPGGKSIIQGIEKALQLSCGEAKASWDTLSKYGNMSSATFLFVLKEMSSKKTDKKWTVGVGFGPGLSMEGVLLERH